MMDREISYLMDRLIPYPHSVSWNVETVYALTAECAVTIETNAIGNIKELVSGFFHRFWRCRPKIEIKTFQGETSVSDDAYELTVEKSKAHIKAEGIAGIRNALYTMRQLTQTRRGTERTEGFFLSGCQIKDSPSVHFRGIHLCVFPETPLAEIEKQIRLAAAHKFNYAVIECWGIFPFHSHPDFGFSEKMLDREHCKELLQTAREMGITPIPQLNLLGHASFARNIVGKHAILDEHPEYQPLFEPDGWSWCLTNPDTRRILTDLVLELHDFFGKPPFFHIGCDEADHLGICRECAKHELSKLVGEQIRYFHDLLAGRGARTLMWHDMLLTKGDQRFSGGYTVCGTPEQKLDNLYKELPRDIIICDWQYGFPSTPENTVPSWPTTHFFHNEGFAAMVCPWLSREGIYSLGALAAREKLFGILETAWHRNHVRNFVDIFSHAAQAAWNPGHKLIAAPALFIATAQDLRNCLQDMGCSDYENTGFAPFQITTSGLE